MVYLFADELAGLRGRRLPLSFVASSPLDRFIFWHRDLHGSRVPSAEVCKVDATFQLGLPGDAVTTCRPPEAGAPFARFFLRAGISRRKELDMATHEKKRHDQPGQSNLQS